MPQALEMTEELIELIQHLEAAEASPRGIYLEFESKKELDRYRRKSYAAKRKVKDSGQGDFTNILLRESDKADNILYLVKEKYK